MCIPVHTWVGSENKAKAVHSGRSWVAPSAASVAVPWAWEVGASVPTGVGRKPRAPPSVCQAPSAANPCVNVGRVASGVPSSGK